jgi:KDO2-lipid IV(A) lauroyltransferase
MSLYSVFYKFLIEFLDLFPYKVLFFVGRVLSFLVYILPNKHKTISLINLNLAFPGETKKFLKEILRESLFHSTMNVLEIGLVWGRKGYQKKEGFIEIKNFADIERSIDAKKGLILFTPHLGNIEILINYLGPITSCTIPYTKPKNKHLDSVITKSRNGAGVEMVDTDPKGIKKILLTLKKGDTVAMASDQVPKIDSGIISKFFNTDIYSLTLVPKLQQKTKCAAHLMYCERKKKGEGFIIHFSKEINLSSELQEGVDKMNNEFEKCIMKIPEQYSWEYKKFKRNNKESIY